MIEPQADFMSVRASRAAQSLNRQGLTPATNDEGAEASSAREKVVELYSRKPLGDRPESDRPESEYPDYPEPLAQPAEKKPRRRAATKQKQMDSVTEAKPSAAPEKPAAEKLPSAPGTTPKKRSRSIKAAQPSTAAQSALPEVLPPGGTEQFDQIQSRVKFLQQITTELATEMDRLKEIAVEIDRGSQAIGNPDARSSMPDAIGFSNPYSSNWPPQTVSPSPSAHPQRTDEYYAGAPRVDHRRSEQDALRMAQILRDRTHREGGIPEERWEPHTPTASETSYAPTRRRTLKSYLRQIRQVLPLSHPVAGRIVDAGLWVVSATLLRMGLKFLVVTFSLPQLPMTLLMAAIAVYLAIFVPRSTAVSIYRLLLIVLGFWLGGH
ncbi:MAG: putative sulfate/molybdate transporter [Scytolyngbya sp. HA4215-MV1]|jgi:hypothetical protein|nr:putative sulfate/molybdate transporter [Scytolyngbya sp. HA4215-MV1]